MSAEAWDAHLDCETCGAWAGQPHAYRCGRRERDEALDVFRGIMIAFGVSLTWWGVFVVLPLVAWAEGWLR